MKDVCILFSYYLDDTTTRHNYDVLKRNNADIDIYPLLFACEFPACLPGTIDLTSVEKTVLKRSEKRDRPTLWRNSDLKIYDFFVNHPERYRRYVYIESDTICNISIRELYRENWDDDLVCKHPLTYERDGLTWRHFTLLDPATRDDCLRALGPGCLAGAVPLCGVLVSERCMLEIVKNLQAQPGMFADMFCEMRIATAARSSHIEMTRGKGLARSTLFEWFPIPFQPLMTRQPGIYHAIKSLERGHQCGKQGSASPPN